MPTEYATLEELRTHTGLPASGSDALLQALLDAAADLVDDSTNSFFDQRTVTEDHSGRGNRHIRLLQRPVISVTSVAIAGSAIDASLYVLDPGGWLVGVEDLGYNPRLFRDARGCGWIWPVGTQNIRVVYEAGYNEVPSAINMATRLIAVDLYDTDQRRGVSAESRGPVSKSYTNFAGYSLPMSARALLAKYVQHEVAG
jgi:hypothetical protein